MFKTHFKDFSIDASKLGDHWGRHSVLLNYGIHFSFVRYESSTNLKLLKSQINPLSANLTKWSNTLKQSTNCLSVFEHFVKLALKGLRFGIF